MNIPEIIFIASSAFSAVFSLVVVVTGILWPRFMLSKNKPFSTMIFYISCCDLLGSSSNCIGFPQRGSVFCSVQGFFFLYFIPASWLWTTMLVYQLRNLILFRKIRLTMTQVHAICWSIPLITSCLPLTTNPYGQDDFVDGYAPCVLGGNTFSKLLWISTCDTGLSFILVVLMAVWSYQISRCLSMADSTTTPIVNEKSLFASMRLYPMALFITWAPKFIELIIRLFQGIGKTTFQIIFVPALIICTQYGTLVAIIFFSQSPTAKLLWYNLFKQLTHRHCRTGHNNTLDDDTYYQSNSNNDSSNNSSRSCNSNRQQPTILSAGDNNTDEVILVQESMNSEARVSIIVEMFRPAAMDGRTSHEIM